ncbi:unnamed protein product [Sphagnum troendelagicum]
MERMAGDLRTLINGRYLEDGQMPFDYNNTITMMLDIAQGMEDFHRCGLIHADLKASNILVTPVIISPSEEEFDGSQQSSELMDFYVKIGDFETSNLVWGQRPKLTAHVNPTMKKLLQACWHAELQERPGWAFIIETLKEELKLHPPGFQELFQDRKSGAQPRIEVVEETIEAAAATSEISNVAVTSWEEVVAVTSWEEDCPGTWHGGICDLEGEDGPRDFANCECDCGMAESFKRGENDVVCKRVENDVDKGR